MIVDGFLSFTIAAVLLICGKILTLRIAALRDYSIPEPVIGGFLCAAFTALVYAFWGREIRFELEVRDFLLLLFFAGIGLKADIGTLRKGGRPFLILLALASGLIVVQNLAAMGMAGLFGLEPRAGLMLGSVSLTGGIGTALAWSPILAERTGVDNVLELGVAANTLGLIAACLIGGPLAAFLIRRNHIVPVPDGEMDIGTVHDEPAPRMDYFCLLWAILILNVTIMLGMSLHAAIAATGLTLPAFVSCLFAGIVMRNFAIFTFGPAMWRTWPGVRVGLALIGDLALGLFLTMTLMGLQLWQLDGSLLFIVTTIALQIALTLAVSLWVVFPAMGRDYEAAVIASGFGGIALGSTATAIANMTAVAQQYGAAHRAFIIVPLVCGFFIDIVNALVISFFAG
ncbi:sodium/glutamate symporter [Sinirhodobacter populi]|uniref:Sodium/glutamate symporter n=1 Tax=Paenirhodobacter populi TaxID=2306993 RepID=A0A443KDH0_9RHOB|nr:sodium/glutamate symporter [Sinirhodobacter populi]RWR30867.1 sodium/glutamate symporter [Sinirhodobacter populi]